MARVGRRRVGRVRGQRRVDGDGEVDGEEMKRDGARS
jgi:hypothetical protein